MQNINGSKRRLRKKSVIALLALLVVAVTVVSILAGAGMFSSREKEIVPMTIYIRNGDLSMAEQKLELPPLHIDDHLYESVLNAAAGTRTGYELLRWTDDNTDASIDIFKSGYTGKDGNIVNGTDEKDARYLVITKNIPTIYAVWVSAVDNKSMVMFDDLDYGNFYDTLVDNGTTFTNMLYSTENNLPNWIKDSIDRETDGLVWKSGDNKLSEIKNNEINQDTYLYLKHDTETIDIGENVDVYKITVIKENDITANPRELMVADKDTGESKPLMSVLSDEEKDEYTWQMRVDYTDDVANFVDIDDTTIVTKNTIIRGTLIDPDGEKDPGDPGDIKETDFDIGNSVKLTTINSPDDQSLQKQYLFEFDGIAKDDADLWEDIFMVSYVVSYSEDDNKIKIISFDTKNFEGFSESDYATSILSFGYDESGDYIFQNNGKYEHFDGDLSSNVINDFFEGKITKINIEAIIHFNNGPDLPRHKDDITINNITQ